MISLIGIVAVGMTYVLVAGEIDLSVGSAYGVLIVIMGLLVSGAGIDPWLATLVVMGLGAVIGALNGTLVTRFRIPSFIVTLAMLTAYRSAALILSGQKPSVTQRRLVLHVDRWLTRPGALAHRVMLVVGVIGGGVLSTSKFGYHVYATGGSVEAARNSGIDTGRVKLMCFVITSALCGLVAGVLWGYLHTAAPGDRHGFEFRVIGAVIVGGVLLSGGRDRSMAAWLARSSLA